MPFFKNVAQKIPVFAVDVAGNAKTGDAANITAQISVDFGATAASDDTNPTELDATDAPGIYYFNALAAETNGSCIILFAKSATTGVTLRPFIAFTDLARVTGAVGAGATTTNVTSNLTEATSDHYKDAFILFTSGACSGQCRKITAYNGSTKALTVDALTDAPTENDTFVLINQ